VINYAGTSAFLFGINWATGGGHTYWWFIFPVLGMGLGILTEMGGLVGEDGVSLRNLFSGPVPQDRLEAGAGAAPALSAGPPPVAAAHPGPSASDAVLNGPHGDVLRQALADRQRLQSLIAKHSDTERQMLPDVGGTADSLYERVVALAAALDRLDAEVGTDRATALDDRIAQIEQQTTDARDRERRLGLLRRQRDMLGELIRSRATLHEQYETAGLLLQNLALDLLKVRATAGNQDEHKNVSQTTDSAPLCIRFVFLHSILRITYTLVALSSTIPSWCPVTLRHMKANAVLVCAACFAASPMSANAAEPRFDLNQNEYAVGVRGYGLDEDTRVIGWQLGNNFYFGRRQGENDDFGFVFKDGDTQYSFTEHGIGWRRSFSFH
jgi:hypothetical protein